MPPAGSHNLQFNHSRKSYDYRILRDLLFVNAAQLVTCAGPARARKGKEMRDAGILKNTAVAVSNGRIAMIGAARDLEHVYSDAEVVDCRGGVLTPGLVD